MTRYIYGSPDANYGRDQNRWARCNNCGFINDLESTPKGGDGDGYVVADQYAQFNGEPHSYGDYSSIDVTLWQINEVGCLYDFDAFGNPLPEEYMARQQNSTSGCQFCGKKNWDR